MKHFVAILSLSVFCPVAASQTSGGGPAPPRVDSPGITPGGAVPRVKWEYTFLTRVDIEKRGDGDFVAGLNKLGDEGWEVVTMIGPRGTQGHGETLLKRLKESPRGAPAPPGGGRGGFRPGQPDGGRGAFGSRPGDRNFRRAAPDGRGLPGQGSNPAVKNADDAAPRLLTQVIRLQHAKAASLLSILQELHGQKEHLRMACDDRTNSLVLVGAETPLAEVVALIQQLDVPGDEKKGK